MGVKTTSRTGDDQAARAAEQQREREAARRREAAARRAEARRQAEAKKKEAEQRSACRQTDGMDPNPNAAAVGGSESNGGALFKAAARRLSDGARTISAAVRNPDRALDVAFKTPMMTERLIQPGDSQSFEVDVEAKGTVKVNEVGTAGVKGKLGGNLTIERREDGDFDVSLKHSATLTKVGDRKKPSPTGESKLGWEGGARVSVTETYTTSPQTVEDRAADLVRDRIGDYHSVAGGPLGELTNEMLDPPQADKDALAGDWSKTKVEGGGFFRGQLSAKYGKMFGVETTIRDDWVQSGAVEVNRDGDVSLTLKLDNDISLKNGGFAKIKGIEGKLQELSDVEGSETTLTLTWQGAANGRSPVDIAQDVLQGNWSSPDTIRLQNKVQEHDFVEQGGGKFTFDGTHAPYTETVTEVTFDTKNAQRHELAALFKGDRAQAHRFNPVASQTVERFSYEGPDIDLKPEIKVPKAIKGVADLSVALEVETGIRRRDALVERPITPVEAVDEIRANALDPLRDPLPTTLGGPNSTPPLDEVAASKPMIAVGSGGPPVAEAQTILKDAGYYDGEVDGMFGPQTEAAVRQFQADNQLAQDGIVGEKTWPELLRAKHGDTSAAAATQEPAPAGPMTPPGVDSEPAQIPQNDAKGQESSDDAKAQGSPKDAMTPVRETLQDIAKVVVGAPVIAAREAGKLAQEGLEVADSLSQDAIGKTAETFAGDKWDRLSDAEKAYVTDNPRLAYVFDHAANRADTVAVERGFVEDNSEKGIYGDAGGNAYRHALWNALMVREAFKQDVRPGVSRDDKLADATREAKAMADAHEDNPKNTNVTNMEMDFRNNDVGRQVAAEVLQENRWASEADIATAIEQVLLDGRLTGVSGGGLVTATDPR